MEIRFSNLLSAEDQQIVKDSNLLQKWLQNVQKSFQVNSLHIVHADLRGKHSIRRPLFIKLEADARDERGNKMHGITVLRGHAVAILPVIRCNGEEYLLLVDQPRFPSGEPHSLEIPAGMLDECEDPAEVACKEMQEETGMIIQKEDLINLLPSGTPAAQGLIISGGLMDERIFLYAVEKEVSQKEFMELQNRKQTWDHEGEHIINRLVPMHEAPGLLQDSKCFAALWFYRLIRQY